MREPCWSVEEGAHPRHRRSRFRSPARMPRPGSPCPGAPAAVGDRSVLKAGPGREEGTETPFGSTLPGVGHPDWPGPILSHPPWLPLHTFLHPLLISPSPKWFLGGFSFGARVPFSISRPANTVFRSPPSAAPSRVLLFSPCSWVDPTFPAKGVQTLPSSHRA